MPSLVPRAALVATVVTVSAMVTAPAPPAGAADRDFRITATCTLRVSGFSHWGKAASSARDMANCRYIQTRLHYGTFFNTWMTYAGPTRENYVRAVAGYYDWKVARGATEHDGYQWHSTCNPSYC